MNLFRIRLLQPEDIFVFGSNLAGRHGAGAAKWARENKGAVYGVGRGLTGSAYAIPTKDENIVTRPLHLIQAEVESFLAFANLNPTKEFYVTNIGCGLAGYKPQQIAPMFRGAPINCHFSPEFEVLL